jgi:hypothetical protein
LGLYPRDARQHLEGGVEIVAPHTLEHAAELVQHQAHPQLRGLVHDDEHHLVVLEGERLLRVEHLVEMQVLAVGERGAELPVNGLAGEVHPLGFVVALRAHGTSSPKTHSGTRRQPSSNSLSRLRYSAQWRATQCQKRRE